MLLQVFTCTTPYAHLGYRPDQPQTLLAVLSEGCGPDLHELADVSPSAASLVERCMSRDPAQRPAAAAVVAELQRLLRAHNAAHPPGTAVASSLAPAGLPPASYTTGSAGGAPPHSTQLLGANLVAAASVVAPPQVNCFQGARCAATCMLPGPARNGFVVSGAMQPCALGAWARLTVDWRPITQLDAPVHGVLSITRNASSPFFASLPPLTV